MTMNEFELSMWTVGRFSKDGNQRLRYEPRDVASDTAIWCENVEMEIDTEKEYLIALIIRYKNDVVTVSPGKAIKLAEVTKMAELPDASEEIS